MREDKSGAGGEGQLPRRRDGKMPAIKREQKG